jgi:hypothetical protein
MNAPCKECTRRKLLCHGFCAEYQQWKQERADAIASRGKEYEFFDYVRVSTQRTKRGKKRK